MVKRAGGGAIRTASFKKNKLVQNNGREEHHGKEKSGNRKEKKVLAGI